MKILILLLAVIVMACNNSADQKKIYEDSAKMFAAEANTFSLISTGTKAASILL